MDKYREGVVGKRMERTAEALRKKGFEAWACFSRQQLMDRVGDVLKEGDSCSCGGSVTLAELGLMEHLRSGKFRFLDRDAEGVDVKEVYHQVFGCKVYFLSANAITEQGEIYNIDGRGNRVAAMIYGPEKVVIVAGYNKIVPDLDAARVRKGEIAGPANAARLDKKELPCYHTGRCSNCNSPERFCSSEVVVHNQKIPGRITVLLVNEDVGY